MGLTVSSVLSEPLNVPEGAEACGSVAQAVSSAHQCTPQEATPLQKK